MAENRCTTEQKTSEVSSSERRSLPNFAIYVQTSFWTPKNSVLDQKKGQTVDQLQVARAVWIQCGFDSHNFADSTVHSISTLLRNASRAVSLL
jgi:hypothetical protein